MFNLLISALFSSALAADCYSQGFPATDSTPALNALAYNGHQRLCVNANGCRACYRTGGPPQRLFEAIGDLRDQCADKFYAGYWEADGLRTCFACNNDPNCNDTSIGEDSDSDYTEERDASDESFDKESDYSDGSISDKEEFEKEMVISRKELEALKEDRKQFGWSNNCAGLQYSEKYEEAEAEMTEGEDEADEMFIEAQKDPNLKHFFDRSFGSDNDDEYVDSDSISDEEMEQDAVTGNLVQVKVQVKEEVLNKDFDVGELASKITNVAFEKA
ncbi:hypothetical protein HDV01_000874 [Terramyces sp. JEL0728]|nr:hypothetical protein HDV01_000874 [Terramyces sp. JEL0728]